VKHQTEGKLMANLFEHRFKATVEQKMKDKSVKLANRIRWKEDIRDPELKSLVDNFFSRARKPKEIESF